MTEKIDFAEFAELCSQWHGGQSSMMYAVASTGELALGSYMPLDCEDEHEWMQKLLRDLLCEINICLRICDSEDSDQLHEFKKKVDSCIDFDD